MRAARISTAFAYGTHAGQVLDACKRQNEFKLWLGENAGNCSAVTVGISDYGRGLFASRTIVAGERIMEVSRSCMLTPEKLPGEVKDFVGTSNDWSHLALLLLAERHKGQQTSKWAPYIRCLSSDIHSTIFWKQKELAFVECSPLHRGTLERQAAISLEFELLKKGIERCPHIFGEAISLNQFMNAYAIVSSRAWGVGPISNVTLIPFIDFCNHDSSIRTLLSYDGDNDSAVVISDRDYQIGDQIFISYGNHSNATLALNYGFHIPYNPYDEGEIWMEISLEDPLRDLKLDLLIAHNMPTLENPDGSQSGGMPFVIKEDDEIPHSARAFARIICAASVDDVKEIIKEAEEFEQPLGWHRRTDRVKECAALNYVVTVVNQHIEQHVKALEALTVAMDHPMRCEMATSVIGGELRVLRKGSKMSTEAESNTRLNHLL